MILNIGYAQHMGDSCFFLPCPVRNVVRPPMDTISAFEHSYSYFLLYLDHI